jgi:hypothetical protein
MTDTIREQIISAIETKMAIIREDKGYQTECGKAVFRVKKEIDPDELPAVIIWPKSESATRQYKADNITMPVEVQGLQLFGDTNPSIISEKILGDLKEALMGRRWELEFTSGGTYQPQPGDEIEGASSGATAIVESIDLDSGSWAGGDAAGTLILRRLSGTFESENLDIGANSNIATTDATIVYESSEESTAGDLVDDINYQSGGTDEYPDAEQVAVGASVLVNIIYQTVAGDPYSQPT